MDAEGKVFVLVPTCVQLSLVATNGDAHFIDSTWNMGFYAKAPGRESSCLITWRTYDVQA